MIKMECSNPSLAELCQTGIAGLDDVLNGGLPLNRFYLLEGDPGVGKTTLALQFLLAGTRKGEKCLYITLSESKEEIEQVARSHGWSLDDLDIVELSGLEKEMVRKTTNTLFHPSEVELQNTVELLKSHVERVQPARIAFDSLSELQLLAESPLRYRRQLLAFKQFFMGRKATVLLLSDHSQCGEGDAPVQSLAHGVLKLERQEQSYGTERLRLRVNKIRGHKFRSGSHDYVIERGGLRVFPRLVAPETEISYAAETLQSSVPELDRLLGGGLDVGTSNLFVGPAGTSKSTLALQYVHCVAKKGGRILFYCFDETLRLACNRAAKVGLDIQPFIKSGHLVMKKVNPAELSPGQFAHEIKEAADEKLDLVVIDSLNGYLAAMPDEKFLNLHLHELLTYLAHRGVTSIMTLAQSGLVGTMNSPVDVTYLADTVVMTRFFESQGAVKKAISVIKKRSDNHETTIREFRVDSRGLRIGEPLVEFRGVLTGTPEFLGDDAKILKTRA
jgi:circadian clock protein KaiC